MVTSRSRPAWDFGDEERYLQKLGSLAASLAIHAGLVALAMRVDFRALLEPRVIFAELISVEAPEPPPRERSVETPPPVLAKPKRLALPKPVETPLPKVEDPEPITPPDPAPTPPPSRVDPSPPTPPNGLVTTPVAEPTPAGTPADEGATFALPSAPPASHPPSASPPPSTALAVSSGDGVTSVAMPRGGYQVRPAYPSSARAVGAQGTTLLRVFVAADGRVMEVGIERSAGHQDLDDAAVQAVRRWRFEPARRGTEPIGMSVLLPVEFRLK